MSLAVDSLILSLLAILVIDSAESITEEISVCLFFMSICLPSVRFVRSVFFLPNFVSLSFKYYMK
jgi:hypothetical protein